MGESADTTGVAASLEDRLAWRRRAWLALGAILIVRLVALAFNRTDLFFDEAQYWTWSLEPAFGYYSKPPLIAWAIALATGVCGSTEFCIRLPSPVIHTATAAVIFALGTRLYSPRTGFLAALGFATIPGVSLSSGIISTDVPLLFCWALALVGFSGLIGDRKAQWPILVMGLGLGLGLNAKYAMAYFALCTGVFLAVTPQQRWLLRDLRMWLGFGLGFALILPNLIWNATNRFATFSHTADNAKWGGALFHPGKALEFFGAQFGVFGPVLFAALLAAAWRWRRGDLGSRERLLLSFCLPILGIVILQAFISRAHANWAAPAYVSATVLVIAALEQETEQRWLKASFWINGVVMAAMIVAVALAGRFVLPGIGDPFARTLGWKDLAAVTKAKLDAARILNRPFASVITDERALTAELLYYMRAEPTPVLAWLGGSRPQDHYELMRPFTKGSPEPVLLVAMRTDQSPILKHFEKAELLTREELPAGRVSKRTVTFYALSGYRGN